MSAIVRSLMLCGILTAMIIAVVPGEQLNTNSDVSIVVLDPKGAGENIYGPQLVVLLCNNGSQSIAVRNYVAAIGDYPFRPLKAHVTDAATGKRVNVKRLMRHVEKPLQESDFVQIRPRHCYGSIVDIRRDYTLKQKQKYNVWFTYSSLAPEKVGQVKPWPGHLRSRMITVVIP